MDGLGTSLRDRIISALCQTLQQRTDVLAGWEGGSVAFDAADEYSDMDLTFLVEDTESFEPLYTAAERAIAAVSPITVSYWEPPGRYYKLKDGGDFLLVDLCFLQKGSPDYCIDEERHGRVRTLFDKGEWLRSRPLDEAAVSFARAKRCHELQAWFTLSQNFVRKAMYRGREAEALSAFWGYTLKPLVQLLRMRHCPARWDFGMRYLERDLPQPVYQELRDLMYVRAPADLGAHLAKATAWGEQLLQELDLAKSDG